MQTFIKLSKQTASEFIKNVCSGHEMFGSNSMLLKTNKQQQQQQQQ